MTSESRCETPPVTLCACGHPVDEHDYVASRYCRATSSGALNRDCVCIPVAPKPYLR
ncbi:RGCVC family protein [Actinoallomurus vinaceus]|uniref:RGCVC family protein n=1 Tax=Actinoallomurus vinaceus TaxID=1080074 RepID=UPI003CD09EF2